MNMRVSDEQKDIGLFYALMRQRQVIDTQALEAVERLRDARYSWSDIAELAEISRQQIQGWYRGQTALRQAEQAEQAGSAA